MKNNYKHLSYFEVRVGDSDIDEATTNHDRAKICLNHLCFRATEPSYAADGLAFDIDCVSPIEGQYITVQKFAGDLDKKALELSEIDIVTFCSGPSPSETICPTKSGSSDECTLAEQLPCKLHKQYMVNKGQT